MFKTNFSGRNKIWEAQKKFWGALPPNAPPWLRAWVLQQRTVPIKIAWSQWFSTRGSWNIVGEAASRYLMYTAVLHLLHSSF